mgnify:CR=1 FL=1|tara:strand:- start:384 stop:716 length:333 start_codon:yes stop_codon:yes gene_type:complete
MEFSDINTNLRKFSEKHDLINHALDSCRIAIQNCLNENPNEGYPLDKTELRFSKQEFIFNNHFSKSPYIKTQIDLYKIDSDKYGSYILNTDEQGNHFDDCLVYENRNINV